MNDQQTPLDCRRYLRHLTQREQQVAQLLCRGYSSKMMARVLGISQRTVETHINNIKFKYHCRRRVQLIVVLLQEKENYSDEAHSEKKLELAES